MTPAPGPSAAHRVRGGRPTVLSAARVLGARSPPAVGGVHLQTIRFMVFLVAVPAVVIVMFVEPRLRAPTADMR